MKLSWRWLSELTDLSGLSPEQGAETLTFHTAEVEGVVPYGTGLEGVVTGRVAAVRPHPQADRLRLCTVDTGGGGAREVVCGAPNVAPGQVICFAPEGVTLPNGLTLTRRKIRGIESAGMICAEDELGLGTDHEGILVLPPATPVGIPLGEALRLPDAILEVSNTAITHRPDLWGHVGFARELAACVGKPLQVPPTAKAMAAAADATEPAFPVEIRDEPGCRRYVGLVLEGLQNGPSPEPIRRRLEALGQRSVDLLVDLTNLVMWEQGQPLHAFDLATLPEGRIVVRGARAGESIVTLDGVARPLDAGDLLICSGDRPVALAGVMGAVASGVGPGTTSVLLESACFDPGRIRRTAARLGLRSEASSRFEKSLDPEGAWTAALRFAELALEHCPGARVARRVADAYPRPYPPLEVEMPYELVRKRLGLRISDGEARASLTALGFRLVREEHHRLVVAVPSWRATKDVSLPEDLVEEVGRMRRYEGVAAVAPLRPMAPVRPSVERRLERRLATTLTLDLGYVEALAHAFHGAREAERLGLADVPHLRIVNPLSEEQDRLALTSAAALLRFAAKNQPEVADGRLWLATRLVVPGRGAGALPREIPVAGLVGWDRGGGDAPPGRLFRGLLGDLRALFGRLGLPSLEVSDHRGEAVAEGLPEPIWFHPGRRATFRAGARVLAVAGEVAPATVRAFGLEGRVVLGEVSLAALVAAGAGDSGTYRPLHRFPVATFDIAVVVPRKTPAGDVAQAISRASPGSVRDVTLFDEYEGAGIPTGTRSLAFTCVLLDAEGTLSPERAEALRATIRAAVEARGWTVRAGDAPR